MDIEALRRHLADKRGKAYWRCLDDLSRWPEFDAFLQAEFPRLKSLWDSPLDRRQFLKLSAAAMAMAGVTACSRQPPEEIVPYVRMPEREVLGKPLFYATTLSSTGPGLGVLVETREGRPLRIEGNPKHPASLGAVDVFAQASILGLYDPERTQGVLEFNQPSTYEAFQRMWSAQRRRLREVGGRGLALLTPPLHSPSTVQAVQALLREFPEARWYVHDPLAQPGARRGAEIAFGRPLAARYDFSRCERVLSLDADFLFGQPGSLRYAYDYAQARARRDGREEINRLYAVESHSTLTGAKADHHQRVKPSQVDAVARQLARKLGIEIDAPAESPVPEYWLQAVAEDLRAHRGRCLVVPGEDQTAAVHALAHAMNAALENVGSTVHYSEPPLPMPEPGLPELVEAVERGQVDALVIFGANPVYTAPADVPFLAALRQVPLRIHWDLYPNETAVHCQWHVPAASELESWGDLLAYDGTASPIQPVVRPLYNGVEGLRFLGELRSELVTPPREQVRAYWRQHAGAADFRQYWQRALHDGVFAGTGAEPVPAGLRPDWRQRLPAPAPVAALELRFAPDPSLWDGRFANNAWLQELPKPLTKISWGNALLINPRTAAELSLENNELTEVRSGGRSLRAPVFWHPAQPPGVVTLHLGYGRERVGAVAERIGADAYRLRRREQPWFAPAALSGTGVKQDVITTQHHYRLEGREDQILRELKLEEIKQKQPAIEDKTPEHSLYPEYEYDGYAWGMVVDINACIGCNACVIACQSENNIPTVGPQQVQLGREMHWLRIDRYYKGPIDEPETLFQPVPCMHCEKAPCEYVCPVHATTHSSEGINEMTYNRCIGTRFCSQNCPYKVRRFNFLDYTGPDATVRAAQETRNPDVTVRSRGVMEKCTYCIQRINRARIQAGTENRRIREGEVRTACQEACPTRAIVFGNLNEPGAYVSRLKGSELNYAMWAELNTRPRTSYLAGIRHPNPEIERHEKKA